MFTNCMNYYKCGCEVDFVQSYPFLLCLNFHFNFTLTLFLTKKNSTSTKKYNSETVFFKKDTYYYIWIDYTPIYVIMRM